MIVDPNRILMRSGIFWKRHVYITWCSVARSTELEQLIEALNSLRRMLNEPGIFVESRAISQLPKLCVKISILMQRRMWVRSFSTRFTSVTFAEDKVLIFLILRKNAKIVQL